MSKICSCRCSKPSHWPKIRSRQFFCGDPLMTLPCAELCKECYNVTAYSRVTFSKGKLRACVLETVAPASPTFCSTKELTQQRRHESWQSLCLHTVFSICH